MVREGRVLISAATGPDFGAGYYVTAYEVGAIVSGGFYPSTTINVDAGHGFAIGDRLIVNTDVGYYRRVTNTTSTSITLNSSLSPTVGDILVNVGPDLGPSEPTFQYSGAAIYDDPDYTTLRSGSTVTTDSTGRYRYYHKGIGIWELVRTPTGVPFAIYTDASKGGVGGFLPLDLDGDVTDEITYYTAPFTANRYLIYLTKTYDASLSSASADRVQSGLKLIQTWTGTATASNTNREGIFGINRFGSAGVGGGTASGPSIAMGGYSEHYGNGTWASSNGAFCGGEFVASMYGPVTMNGTTFGALCTTYVNNTYGGTTIMNEVVGVRGNILTASGTVNMALATAVSADISHATAGTITDARAVSATFGTVSGGGVITTAYGLWVEEIVAGSTNNYGLYLGGASTGATNNYALYVASGKTLFADTTAFHIVRSNNSYFNDGTDRDATIWFDTSTADGGITYKGGSALNLFEFNKPIRINSENTALYTIGHLSEAITLSTSGTTTDSSANLLPANALILGVSARVNTTITTATDWKLGDATQAARFCAAQSGAQLTAGATVVGLAHHDPTVATANLGPVQSAAAKLRITTTGTPGAGVIRVTVFYMSFGAPAS